MMLKDAVRDLRSGIRSLLRDWRFTAASALTLALCIGANTIALSVLDSVVLRPLGHPEADSLTLISNSYPNAGLEDAGASVPDYFDRRESIDAFEDLALFNQVYPTIELDGAAERIPGLLVTPSFFRLLRIQPELGSLFIDAEDDPDGDDKVLLSYGAWQRFFGGSAEALGEKLEIFGAPYDIVGVLPRNFEFLEHQTQVWIPVAFEASNRQDSRRHSNNWRMIGRLAPGANLELARRQIDSLNASNLERFPELKEVLIDSGFHTRVVPLREAVLGEVRGSLFLLWSGVIFLLLIGCINLSSLTLIRGDARRMEFLLRKALGASRGQIFLKVTMETFLLTALGSGVGLLLGWFGLNALSSSLSELPRSEEIALRGTAVIAALGLTLGIALALSWLSVWQQPSGSHASLSESERTRTSGHRRSRWFRHSLVGGQLAITLVLLVGAALLLASFRHVLAESPGFDSRRVTTASFALPQDRYESGQQQLAFIESLRQRVLNFPGIESAGATSSVPLGDEFRSRVILAEGYWMSPGESVFSPVFSIVTPGYFQTMRIPILAGRDFDPRDTEEVPGVIIVDQRLAKRFWGQSNPIGRRVFLPSNPQDITDPGPEEDRLTVIGVVGEVKTASLVQGDEPVGAFYLPYGQSPTLNMTLVVKSADDSMEVFSALRREASNLDPQVPLYQPLTMEERIDSRLGPRRTPMMLAVGFAGLALVLALLGLYGTLSYVVVQRRWEFGIRIALGSGPQQIIRLVLQDALFMIIPGLVLGLFGAASLGRALRSQLYGVRPMDPTILSLVALLLSLACLMASWIPAARAAEADPATALSEA